jgi:TonB family protein
VPSFFTHRRWLLVLFCGCCFAGASGQGQTAPRPISIAVLDFGQAGIGRLATEQVAATLTSTASVTLVDRDLGQAAARGAGYSGSLNMSLPEARDLGAAIGCDFYFLGDAQTVRRSPSTGPIYFESYASIFLVSTRTGRLVSWERPSFQAAGPEAAERQLLDQLKNKETQRHHLSQLQRARETEQHEREVAIERALTVIEEGDTEGKEDDSLRSPRPYRRLKPPYPDTAARADAEGTVDVLAEIDRTGEVGRVEVARWAGFGLDDAALNTVRQLHFFPATRSGVAIPIRVLLRYNFRRPPR